VIRDGRWLQSVPYGSILFANLENNDIILSFIIYGAADTMVAASSDGGGDSFVDHASRFL
jgi:hypothetical protein